MVNNGDVYPTRTDVVGIRLSDKTSFEDSSRQVMIDAMLYQTAPLFFPKGHYWVRTKGSNQLDMICGLMLSSNLRMCGNHQSCGL